MGKIATAKKSRSFRLKDSPTSERKLPVFSEHCPLKLICLPSIERNSLSLKFIEKFLSITLVKPGKDDEVNRRKLSACTQNIVTSPTKEKIDICCETKDNSLTLKDLLPRWIITIVILFFICTSCLPCLSSIVEPCSPCHVVSVPIRRGSDLIVPDPTALHSKSFKSRLYDSFKVQ